MLTIKKFVFNPFSVNTWLIHDDAGETILVDPACQNLQEQEELMNYCKRMNLKVCALINTHGHFDHTCGLKWARDQFSCSFYAHHGDELFFRYAREQAASFGFEVSGDPPEIDHYLHHGDHLDFGKLHVEIRHAPGHSPGSVVLSLQEAGVVLTGDLLFQGSIGRSDLPGGDYDQLLHSIQSQLLNLEDHTRVLPGHGAESTIIAEKLTNPFLRHLT